MNKLYLLIAFVFLGNIAVAQEEQIWEFREGGPGEDIFRATLEASNGYIISVGQTSGNNRAGKNGFFVKQDFSTGDLIKKELGSIGQDGFNAVVQTEDGFFLSAGFTDSYGAGKSDGWLVKIDENGKKVWSGTKGGGEDDVFYHMEKVGEDHIVIAGIMDKDEIWVAQYKVEEEINLDNPVWEKRLTEAKYRTIEGITVDKNKNIIVIGNTNKTKNTNRDDIWYLKIDQTGTITWSKDFGDSKLLESAVDVLATKDGGFVILGNVLDPRTKFDPIMAKFNAAGTKRWEKPYNGNREDDIAESFVQGFDGSFYIVGKSLSHKRGARQNKAFLIKTDQGGVTEFEGIYFGGEDEDVAHDVMQLHDETLVVAGVSSSNGAKGKDAWVFRLGDDNLGSGYRNSGGRGERVYEIKQSDPWLNTTDGFLKPNEATFLSFELENNHGQTFKNVNVQVEDLSGNEPIVYWDNIYLGPLEDGEKRKVNIPIKSENIAETRDNLFGITVFSEGNKILKFEHNIKTKNPKPATLKFGPINSIREGDSEFAPYTVEIPLENIGDAAASGVNMQILAPKGVTILEGQFTDLGTLDPKVVKAAKVRIQKTIQYEGTTIQLNAVASDASGSRVRKPIDVEAVVGSISGEFILFVSPSEAKGEHKNLNTDRSKLKIEAVIGSSSSDLRTKDPLVKLNNKLVERGSRMGEGKLSPPELDDVKRVYYYNYENEIQLEEGVNRIVVEFRGPRGIVQSSTIEVNYLPKKPNLHVLAIGVPHDDLDYTVNDARDFAKGVYQQYLGVQGQIYDQIFIDTLVSTKDTEKSFLEYGLDRLLKRYQSDLYADQISKEDVLMVFISSHGKMVDSRLKILASDYKLLEDVATIDYKTQLLEVLNRIDCKKFLFIDACHSGAAGSRKRGALAVSKALEQINSTYPGLAVITSSQEDQLSYEDDSWKNGAFTESILETLDNKICFADDGTEYSSDQNRDGQISLEEFKNFISKRVRSLVSSKKNKEQMPKIHKGNEFEWKYPIFFTRP